MNLALPRVSLALVVVLLLTVLTLVIVAFTVLHTGHTLPIMAHRDIIWIDG
jgi:hypothetical protein